MAVQVIRCSSFKDIAQCNECYSLLAYGWLDSQREDFDDSTESMTITGTREFIVCPECGGKATIRSTGCYSMKQGTAK